MALMILEVPDVPGHEGQREQEARAFLTVANQSEQNPGARLYKPSPVLAEQLRQQIAAGGVTELPQMNDDEFDAVMSR